jgi:hypothetical protein
MDRSQINSIMQSVEAFIRQFRFHLPPFAYWKPKDWEERRNEAGEILATVWDGI